MTHVNQKWPYIRMIYCIDKIACVFLPFSIALPFYCWQMVLDAVFYVTMWIFLIHLVRSSVQMVAKKWKMWTLKAVAWLYVHNNFKKILCHGCKDYLTPQFVKFILCCFIFRIFIYIVLLWTGFVLCFVFYNMDNLHPFGEMLSPMVYRNGKCGHLQRLCFSCYAQKTLELNCCLNADIRFGLCIFQSCVKVKIPQMSYSVWWLPKM